MPHQCVKCGTFYDDGSSEILKGCSKCKSRLFFFVRKEKLEQAKLAVTNLSDKEKEKIEEDVLDLVGTKQRQSNKPVILDFESIRVSKPGKYELDLVNLFQKKNPLIYQLEDGKYVIDLAESFKKLKPKE